MCFLLTRIILWLSPDQGKAFCSENKIKMGLSSSICRVVFTYLLPWSWLHLPDASIARCSIAPSAPQLPSAEEILSVQTNLKATVAPRSFRTSAITNDAIPELIASSLM